MSVKSLQSYFAKNGLLLCNLNKDLPSLDTVGGDWSSIIELMEQGEVFYSKLYKGRVTYLSKELYYQIKPYKQRIDKLSPKSQEILDFIETVELATTKEIKVILNMHSTKEFNLTMDELVKELLITFIKQDKILNANWGSFWWGSYKTWEKISPHKTEINPIKINELLSDIMIEKQIKSLL